MHDAHGASESMRGREPRSAPRPAPTDPTPDLADPDEETAVHAMPTTEGADRPGPEAAPLDLEGLFAAYHADVYRAAWRVTGDPQDAEDVVQTVFLRLARRPPSAAMQSPGAYLRRSGVHAALDLVRARGRRKVIPIDKDDRPLAIPTPEPVLTQEAAGELRDRLRRALARLSPRSAEIFALRYFEGFSNLEIAEQLGTSASSIGVTLHRSRAQLRAELGESA